MPHISQSDSQTLESGELSVSPEYLIFLLNNSLIFFLFFFSLYLDKLFFIPFLSLFVADYNSNITIRYLWQW